MISVGSADLSLDSLNWLMMKVRGIHLVEIETRGQNAWVTEDDGMVWPGGLSQFCSTNSKVGSLMIEYNVWPRPCSEDEANGQHYMAECLEKGFEGIAYANTVPQAICLAIVSRLGKFFSVPASLQPQQGASSSA
jgi:hypothetical protein